MSEKENTKTELSNFRMKGFTPALESLVPKHNMDEYRSKESRKSTYDCSNYVRIYKWTRRTTKKLIGYLAHYQITSSSAEEDIDFFMHHLLAIYFQAFEIPSLAPQPTVFKNSFTYFINNCLQCYEKVNRKGHLCDRIIYPADMSLFCAYLLGTKDNLLSEDYILTTIQREKITQIKACINLSPQDQFLELVKIFFQK